MYCPNNGTAPSEPANHFTLVTTSSLSPLGGPVVDTAVLVKNELTGKYCRVVIRSDVPVEQSQQIKCDVEDPSLATPMVFNGTHVTTEQGQTLTNPCSSCPLYLGGGGTPGSIDPCERSSTVLHAWRGSALLPAHAGGADSSSLFQCIECAWFSLIVPLH